jgi:hypothetical protein
MAPARHKLLVRNANGDYCTAPCMAAIIAAVIPVCLAAFVTSTGDHVVLRIGLVRLTVAAEDIAEWANRCTNSLAIPDSLPNS